MLHGVVLIVGMYCILYTYVFQKLLTSWMVLEGRNSKKQVSLDEVMGVRLRSWDAVLSPARDSTVNC